MKTLILVIASVFIIGCGGGGGGGELVTAEECVMSEVGNISIGYVRDYNVSNSANRVNVFISMGQSNSVGVLNTRSVTVPNVFMPVESMRVYPDTITFTDLNNSFINKADLGERNLINTATKFAEEYNSVIPLYVVNIARGSQSISLEKCNVRDHLAMNRKDIDNLSMYPQSIHYLQTLFAQLQAEGKEPYLVGLDWNQWESEPNGLSAYEYYIRYDTFFNGISNVIPNKDFKLFICNPTSTGFGHRETLREAFTILKNNRVNVNIYRPDKLGAGNIWRDAPKMHYTEIAHQKMAEFIYLNL